MTPKVVRCLLVALLICCCGIGWAQNITFQPIVTPGLQQENRSQQIVPQQGTSSQVDQNQQAPPGTEGTPTPVPSHAPALQVPSQIPQAPSSLPVSLPPGATEQRAPDRSVPSAPGLTVEEVSDFEKYVAGKSPEKLSFDIKQFGYDLFLAPPTLTGPVQRTVPVGPEYVMGPGDELRVNVWGSIEGVWNVVVDRDGAITLPKVGTLGIAGLSFQETKAVIQKELAKQYTDFEMNVSMGQLRGMGVYVVGKARKPGAFVVSSLSTLLNALQESGGPSKVGTMRDIQLKRNGETIAHLDLYDFLLTGNKENDVRLMPGDVIFIPAIGPMVGIAGDVKVPAIYELKGAARVSDVIKLAGGTTAKAFTQRVQVERFSKRTNKAILDLNLGQLKGKNDILLEDGDVVKVFAVTENVTNRVVLKGNVRRPGEYEWRKGMRVRDLLKSTEELLPETLMERAQIDRLVPPDYHLEYETFDLGKVLLEGSESENLLLAPYDTVIVFNKWEVKERDKVRSSGALNKPGEFDYRKNMRLSDLIGLSGGLKYYASAKEAELTRVKPTPEGPVTEKITVYPSSALQGNPEADILLQENDYLFVRAIPEWDLYKLVTVGGQVMYPGAYSVDKREKLSSLLTRAGGFTDVAYLQGAVLVRESVKRLQQEQINRMVDKLQRELLSSGSVNIGTASTPEEAKILQEQEKQKALFLESLRHLQAQGRLIITLDRLDKLRGSQNDIELEEGDSLYIPTKPATIQVIGAVYNPSAMLFEQGRDVSYYIRMSGGFSENADSKNTYVLKVNGRALKPKGKFLAWDRDSNSWRSSGYADLQPGDTIVVPERLEKVAWMRNIKDIAQILFQVGTAAGVVVAAGL